jgi:hypothetical protein
LDVSIYRETPADNGDDSGEDEMLIATQPSRPPMFTESLGLYLKGGMKLITRRLLSLPGGIHLWELVWTWFDEEDLSLATALVEGCSRTLESLDITCDLLGKSIRHLRPH